MAGIPYTCSNRAYGGAASGLVVLSGTARERPRLSTWPDRRAVDAARVPADGCSARARPRPPGDLLPGTGLPVGGRTPSNWCGSAQFARQLLQRVGDLIILG